MKQFTIKKRAVISGTGLHTGAAVKVSFYPMKEGSGISLLDGEKKYRLDIKMVRGTNRGTVIKYGNKVLHTTEHMLSAVKAAGIDNIGIECEGGEAPILDGSAAGFSALFKKTGLAGQAAVKKVLTLKEPLLFRNGDKYLAAFPGNGFLIYYFSDFSARGIAPEESALKLTPESFISEIAGARTFGFKDEIAALKKAGLIKGATVENAVVIDKGRPVKGRLRYKNELTRHKVLDIIGDFSFIEGDINMTLIAYKTGHTENIEMVRMLLKT